ncbi:MAG: glycosyltransferase family 4 protein [Hyphomicrobiales bacterium]
MHIRFIIPGDIDTPTGGYRYDRAIIDEWRKLGVGVDLISLLGDYPFANEADIQTALSIIDKVQDADICVIDGLAGGCAPSLMQRCAKQMPVVALIHHPLALENGQTEAQSMALEKLEREGLGFAKAVVTTSPATSKTVHQLFNYPVNNISAIMPGVERGAPIPFRTQRPLRLLSVGSITERKGHDVLLRALSTLHDLSWTLDIVGLQHLSPETFDDLQKITQEGGISDRVNFHDGVDAQALDKLYHSADLFALASRYEGYGMAYAEAIVRGLPVIATTAGAIPDTVPESAGLLVTPDDIDTLTDALRIILSDDDLRRQKHMGALKAEADFPTWEKSAEEFHSLLRRLQ